MRTMTLSDSERGSKRKSRGWNWFLILFPILIAAGLLTLRQIEVHRMASRPSVEYGSVPPFSLTNQEGMTFGSPDLAGKVWIADFIYTTCPGPCPMISTRMGEMQKPLRDTDVHFVSITVDPAKDSPPRLKEYAKNLGAQSGRWDFLTGSKADLYRLIDQGFHLTAMEGAGPKGELVHDTRMVLVDRAGQIRGYYDATAPDAITRLISDANRLAKSSGGQR